jgi:oxygen-independent coproporphyrinogen-3 oxidase
MVRQGQKPVDNRETLSAEQKQQEFIFLALRTLKGLSLKEYKEQFDRCFLSDHKETVDNLVAAGHLQAEGDRIFLSRQGLLVSDAVFTEFM